ncbi:MAG: helix-turn-helix domain-containing protein [Lachnospiraceae bacterium]|nr:helix-turn-helix domain-containing protein [Lachnospiraceae bacterium]
MEYIKLPKVYEKLKKAEELFAPVIMTAGTGVGKTASCEYYFRRKNTLTLICHRGKMTDPPPVKTIRSGVVIVENMQELTDDGAIRYLHELLDTPGIQVIMLTRGNVPGYLLDDELQLGFIRIQEKDFRLDAKCVGEYFKEKGLNIDPDETEKIAEVSRGYFLALHCYATRLENGESFGKDMVAAVWQDIFRLWDSKLFEKWTDEYINFALNMCRYEKFTKKMAEYLTGNKKVGRVIEYSHENTDQIKYLSDGYYSFREEVRDYFKWKQSLVWSKEEIRENILKAAKFYEMNEDITLALMYYREAGATASVKDLLIRNANTHPGAGHYIETKDYYFELPEEEIKEMPVLMSGMSMLYALLLRPDKSEEWYAALEAYEQDKNNSRERRREARTRLAYLDIALPHRGTKGILRVMKNVFTLMQKGNIHLPEFSVTGNLPSVMNGGLDFCEWSKSDTQIAKFMAKPIESITGMTGSGLVTIALAESGFEKGTMSAYEVLTRCNCGYEASSHGGRIELSFVAVGIQVRQHLVEGQLPSAKRVCDSFGDKIRAEKAEQLYPNYEAFRVWISLFGGIGDDVKEYSDNTPDAKVSFCILDRYRQMIKLRCLIAQNRLDEALDLAGFLNGYFVKYERHFYRMENEVLKAIILYRMENPVWKECLVNAFKKAEEYHFVRLLSLEGAALLALISALEEEGGLEDIDKVFLKQVEDEASEVASFYPDYLKYTPKETVTLTKREKQVLSMLCSGLTTEEICTELKITYDGLKKHNRNIYKKLGVKGRAEAERKAARLGIIQR